MKISQKLEYGCRACIQLAKRIESPKPYRLEDIASKEYIPEGFLVHILNELRMGGVVNSQRGRGGGYRLTTTPANINMFTLVRILEPNFMEHKKPPKEAESGLVLQQAWDAVGVNIRETLEGYTLEKLAHSMNGRD